MRLSLLPAVLLAPLLTSCANQGVIVRKDSGPLPFYESLGVDGSYKFAVRDSAGGVHRQLVTPEVFEHYAVGQYFNDQDVTALQREPSAAPQDASTGHTGNVRTAGAGKYANGSRGTVARTDAAHSGSPTTSKANSTARFAKAKAKAPAAPSPEEENPAISGSLAIGVQRPSSMHLVASDAGDSSGNAAVRPQIKLPNNPSEEQAEPHPATGGTHTVALNTAVLRNDQPAADPASAAPSNPAKMQTSAQAGETTKKPAAKSSTKNKSRRVTNPTKRPNPAFMVR
jgi:hypothetical protein